MVRLTTDSVEQLHLLSLLVRERLGRTLETPAGQTQAAKLRGTVGLVAGGMETRMRFDGSTVHLDQGPATKARVRGQGTLAAFLAICQGKVGPVELLRGHVRASGNPVLLLKALRLLTPHDDHERRETLS